MINQELIDDAKSAGFDVEKNKSGNYVIFAPYDNENANGYFSINNELAKFAELIKARVLAEIKPLKCPNCEDVGWFADYDQHGNIEQCQCEFCYTTPNSIFNLNEAIKLAKDK